MPGSEVHCLWRVEECHHPQHASGLAYDRHRHNFAIGRRLGGRTTVDDQWTLLPRRPGHQMLFGLMADLLQCGRELGVATAFETYPLIWNDQEPQGRADTFRRRVEDSIQYLPVAQRCTDTAGHFEQPLEFRCTLGQRLRAGLAGSGGRQFTVQRIEDWLQALECAARMSTVDRFQLLEYTPNTQQLAVTVLNGDGNQPLSGCRAAGGGFTLALFFPIKRAEPLPYFGTF